MTVQFSDSIRNARADAVEVTVGTAPLLQFFNGAKPANCAAADAGTKIAEGALPSDWMANAATGVKTKAGTWTVTGLPAAAGGTAANYFRIKDSSGVTCHEQGSISITGGGGDMTVDNTSVANAQVVNVQTYTLTEGNS